MADNKGVWLDKDTGKVVKKQPQRSRQLVRPGKEMTSALEALVERYRNDDLAPPQSVLVDLDAMTKDELFDLAGERGVDVAKSSTKAEIIEALGG